MVMLAYSRRLTVGLYSAGDMNRANTAAECSTALGMTSFSDIRQGIVVGGRRKSADTVRTVEDAQDAQRDHEGHEQRRDVGAHVQAERLEAGHVYEDGGRQPCDVQGVQVDVAPASAASVLKTPAGESTVRPLLMPRR